ncbi:MAG: hypothetical protein ACKVU4_00475 [Phycisphaerales bacterium]
MRYRDSLLAGCIVSGSFASGAGATVINFDDRPGLPPPFSLSAPVAPQFIVDDEYELLGVLFSSTGGGIAIVAPGNPVSTPNTATATGPGPVLSETHDVTATFMIGTTPATVDLVSITLSNSSSLSTFQAFALNGTLLGQTTGGASATLTVSFPGLIHRVVIKQGPMAFDDFTFEGLIPAPGVLCVLGAAGLAASRRRR